MDEDAILQFQLRTLEVQEMLVNEFPDKAG
jgi:hypothetical protein